MHCVAARNVQKNGSTLWLCFWHSKEYSRENFSCWVTVFSLGTAAGFSKALYFVCVQCMVSGTSRVSLGIFSMVLSVCGSVIYNKEEEL
jgi:RsiW-degrading membrane proteinase PrsW (M82 family)